MSRTKHNGKHWDVLSLPDPYIVIDGHPFEAYGCIDNYTCTFVTNKIGIMTIDVWDKDV